MQNRQLSPGLSRPLGAEFFEFDLESDMVGEVDRRRLP